MLNGSTILRSAFTVSLTAVFLFLSACTNQASTPTKANRKLAGGENSVFQPNQATAFTLQTVAPNPLDSNVLNLVGDGSGDIGRYCIATQGNGSTNYSCTCSFKYTRTNGSTVDWIDTNLLYREEDLIQCSSSIILADAVTVSVRIHVINSDSYSTQIDLAYQSVLGGDTSNALNLANVGRYQCRDAVFAPLPLMAGNGKPVYDPFISDDPEISYPLNYYYTNKGAALSSFVANPATVPTSVQMGNSSVNVGWFCPSDKDYTHDQRDLNLFSLKEYNLGDPIPPVASYDDATNIQKYWDGMTTAKFSMAEPNTATADFQKMNIRSDFALSRKPSGVFSMPVQAYVAPNTIDARMSDVDGSSMAPIGYGAVPTPKGDDQEACPTPTEAVIPTGYHWVKVWLARASLETRKTPVSEKFGQLAGLIQPPNDPDRSMTQDCGQSGGVALNNGSATADYSDQHYRIIANTGACAFPDPSEPGNITSFRNKDAQSVGNSNSTIRGTTLHPGNADTWILGTNNSNLAAIPAIGVDYRLLSNWIIGFLSTISPLSFNDVPNATNFSIDGITPNNVATSTPLSAASYTPLEQNSRYDYLFIVTPTNIHSKHMIYPNSSDYESYGKYFIPYRLRSSEYFGVGTCDITTPDKCPDAAKIFYSIKLHGVQYQGDAPNPITDPGRLPVFPVCALQKDL